MKYELHPLFLQVSAMINTSQASHRCCKLVISKAITDEDENWTCSQYACIPSFPKSPRYPGLYF